MTHPRDVYTYEGDESAFDDALGRGRLHHAWLLTGPEGVGKATFAYRAARRLLGGNPSDPADRVNRQMAARAHPDLLVLELAAADGKPRRSIPVEEARQLPEFFSKAPAAAPYRVAIIDAADDLNVNAANAVLKTLEEPPERGVLLLVSHSPGRLLPTIRSRCRRLTFAPWSDERVAAYLIGNGVGEHDAARLALMASGAPGKAMTLAQEGALSVDQTAHDILRALPQRDERALLAVAEGFRGAEGQRRFELLFERLAAQVHDMASKAATSGETAGLDRWAGAWEHLIHAPREAEGLNLDRADVFWTAMARLGEAARA